MVTQNTICRTSRFFSSHTIILLQINFNLNRTTSQKKSRLNLSFPKSNGQITVTSSLLIPPHHSIKFNPSKYVIPWVFMLCNEQYQILKYKKGLVQMLQRMKRCNHIASNNLRPKEREHTSACSDKVLESTPQVKDLPRAYNVILIQTFFQICPHSNIDEKENKKKITET